VKVKYGSRLGRAEGVIMSGMLAAAGLLGGPAARAGNFYAGTSPANVPWPGGVVPYEFTNTLTAAQQQTFLNGLREWTLAANVSFVPHTNQSRWVLFAYDTNLLDAVLSGYSPQVVTVNSLSRAQVCHEMGHSFGFTHENIRIDAASHVEVLTNNIEDEPVNLYWFTIDPTSVTNGNYDFESVMHLGWDFASLQFGALATQQPKPPYFPRYQYRMGNLCLSPGDRAALAYLYGPPAVPLTNIVTTTADWGAGSLRAAMYYVADNPGSVVRFNIPTNDPGYSNGVFTIHLTGYLPPLATNGMVIDGSTEPGFSNAPLIVIDGSQILPETFTPTSGLLVYSASNQVKSLSFQGFSWNGLTLEYADATNNTIAGCWLGLDDTGANAAPNLYQGILLQLGASGNLIGGTNALARNVLSGNMQYGIFITGSNTSGNVVSGSYVGSDASGSNAVPNWLGGVIVTGGAHNNVIGGAAPPARNIISGNTNVGIWLTGSGVVSNLVIGNFVGLNAGGGGALANTFAGMYVIAGAQSNWVIGNVFSGQPSEGLRLAGAGTSWNVVQGNYIGTDATGTKAVPNGFAGADIIQGASSNVLGGTTSPARNVISGNANYGVVIEDPGSSGNLVEGNWIGTDATGTNALPNAFANVALWNGATGNTVGGAAAGAGNVIADSYLGVILYDDGTTNDAIRDNSIFGNSYAGIVLNGMDSNHLGGPVPGPNDFQNSPVLAYATGHGTSTVIAGTLNSTSNRSFWIDIYRNPAAGPGGYGEGQFYVGTATAATDGSGNASFALTVGGNFSGQYFAASASDQVSGDTSEFSPDVLATNGAAPPEFVSPPGLTRTGLLMTVSLTAGQSYRVQAATNLAVEPILWTDLTNLTASGTNFSFLDRSATNYRARFYRVVSP
jgi:hypothetical protein